MATVVVAACPFRLESDLEVSDESGASFPVAERHKLERGRLRTAAGHRAGDAVTVGFVPPGHIRGEARLKDRWTLALELDGAAAPEGRAFDFSATVKYQPTPRWIVAVGYRTIAGGADVDEVFTFAWLNATIVRLGGRI